MNELRSLARRGASSLLALALGAGCAETHAALPPDCDCAVSEVCLRGECVADCDVSAIAATLDPNLTVVRSFCVELEEGPVGAFERPDGSLEIFHAHGSTVGRDTSIGLDSLVAVPATGSLDDGVSCPTTTFTADQDGVTVTLTRDLAVSPDGTLVAWGVAGTYENDGGSRIRVPGRWDLAAPGTCRVEAHPFPHVEGIAFGSDARGGVHVLVSGGLGGPAFMNGVFLDDGMRVLAESGPGSIWRLGDAILVGSVLGHGVMPATLIPLASIRAGVEVREGEEGVVSGDAGANRFVALEGRGIVTEAPAEPMRRVGLELRSLEVLADELVFGEPVLIAGPEITAAIPIAGTRRFLLRHAGGLLLVE